MKIKIITILSVCVMLSSVQNSYSLSNEEILRLDVCPGYAEFAAVKKFFPNRTDISHADAGNLIAKNPKADAYAAHLYKWCLKHYRQIKFKN